MLPIIIAKAEQGLQDLTSHHMICLERRLGWWSNKDLDELVREGRGIQQRDYPNTD